MSRSQSRTIEVLGGEDQIINDTLQLRNERYNLAVHDFNPEVFRRLVAISLNTNLADAGGPTWIAQIQNLGNRAVASNSTGLARLLGRLLENDSGLSGLPSTVQAVLGSIQSSHSSGNASSSGDLLPVSGNRTTLARPVPRIVYHNARQALINSFSTYGRDGRGGAPTDGGATYQEALANMYSAELRRQISEDDSCGDGSGSFSNGMFCIEPSTYSLSEVDDLVQNGMAVSVDSNLVPTAMILADDKRAPDLTLKGKVVHIREAGKFESISTGKPYARKTDGFCNEPDIPILSKVKFRLKTLPRAPYVSMSRHLTQDYDVSQVDTAKVLQVAVHGKPSFPVLCPDKDENKNQHGILFEGAVIHRFNELARNDKSHKYTGTASGSFFLPKEWILDSKGNVMTIRCDNVRQPATLFKFVTVGTLHCELTITGDPDFTYTVERLVTMPLTSENPRLRRGMVPAADARLTLEKASVDDDRVYIPPPHWGLSPQEVSRIMQSAVVHGVRNVDLHKDLILRLATHDRWSGLPWSPIDHLPEGLAGLGNDTFNIPGSPGHPESEMNMLLRFSGIEYDDLVSMWNRPSPITNFERLKGLPTSFSGKEFITYLANEYLNLLFRFMVSMDESYSGPRDQRGLIPEHVFNMSLPQDYVTELKSNLQKVYDESAITGIDDIIYSATVPGRKIEVDIMLARYFLSLTNSVIYDIDEGHQYATTLLPPRINKARMIPVCLTESGYRVVTATNSVLNSFFLKEPVSGRSIVGYVLDNFDKESTAYKFIQMSESKKGKGFQVVNSDKSDGLIDLHAIVRAPIISTSVHTAYVDLTHGIIVNNTHLINLDYLIATTLHQLYHDGSEDNRSVHANRMVIIYDKWFIILFLIPSVESQRTGVQPLVVIKTSTRPARIAPHSKNKSSSLRRVLDNNSSEVLVQSTVSTSMLYLKRTREWNNSPEAISEALRRRTLAFRS